MRDPSMCGLWLAEPGEGHPLKVQLVDGPHWGIEGVKEAAKLHHRIFGAEDDWFVVTISELPEWGDAPINDGAAAECAALLNRPIESERSDDAR